MDPQLLLSARLSASYPGRPDVLRGISLDIRRHEILGLAGQSGCGKSTLALAILKLLHLKGGKMDGSMVLNGRDLMSLKEKEMRSLRGRDIALVSQSPIASLNPALRVRTQMEEAWNIHQSTSSAIRDAALREALESVSLPCDDHFLGQYPAQLSVGQAQRVLIAMAVLHRPQLLIADEATSALDIITQSEVLALFARLSCKLGMSILYISHDLLSVARISQRVAVMSEGQIVECRATADLFADPEHPYTRRLIDALPVSSESMYLKFAGRDGLAKESGDQTSRVF